MKPGLVSVTFRQLSPEGIIDLCASSGLQAIEWGDVYVPPGDDRVASRVGEMTRRAGLSVAAYGSYYRLAASEASPFEEVLASAEAMGAPAIRVWAGNRGSADTDETGPAWHWRTEGGTGRDTSRNYPPPRKTWISFSSLCATTIRGFFPKTRGPCGTFLLFRADDSMLRPCFILSSDAC